MARTIFLADFTGDVGRFAPVNTKKFQGSRLWAEQLPTDMDAGLI